MDSKLNVLIACEESQRVCMEFRKLGHNAYSCDLMDSSGGHPEWHIKGDCVPLINGCCEFKTQDGTSHIIKGKWDMLGGHPPCTYFSTAGAPWLFRGGKLNMDRYNKGLKMKDLFLTILNADCPHIYVENPTPMKLWQLPPHSQVIQPWQFSQGDEDYQKKTLLWLKGLPFLQAERIEKPDNVRSFVCVGCGGKSNHGLTNKSKSRSKTFRGIAKAIAEQWSNYLTNTEASE